MNSVRSAYCFKLQSEQSYDTLIAQFGSGCTNIKIEKCEHIPDQHQAAEEIGIASSFNSLRLHLNSNVCLFQDTEMISEMTSIGLPPKIIDDLDIKLEPEEEEGSCLVEVTDM